MSALLATTAPVPAVAKRGVALSALQRVIPEELARCFTPLEAKGLRETFGRFDASGDGCIDKWELAKVMTALGERPSEQDLDRIIKEVDTNGDGVIQFDEFCFMMHKAKAYQKGSAFLTTGKKMEKKLLSRDQISTIRFADGSLFQGQASQEPFKQGVFEGHGTYEMGKAGDAYTGDFKNGMFHGMGHMWYKDNSVYEGSYAEGLKCGSGTMRFPDGSMYVGDLERGLFHGYGEYACGSGDVFKGHWVGGKKHGPGKMFYRDGASFEGHWDSDSRRAGEGTFTSKGGDVYCGAFNSKGLYHGVGRLVRADTGDVYEGDFTEGRKEGCGRMVYGIGDEYEGQWAKGAKTGLGTYAFADGNRYSGAWKNDRMEGKGTYTFSSGDSYEGDFVSDVPCGQGVSLYANGNRYAGRFSGGLPDGDGTMTYAPIEDGGSEVVWSGTWRQGLRVPGSGALEATHEESVDEASGEGV